MEGIVNLWTAQLFPHPDNPRRDLGDLTELAASIKENGVLQNLTVVPKPIPETTPQQYTYTVIIGHRRLAAAKLAGLDTVPCAVVEMTPREQMETMLMENMQRSDLTAFEQARGFQMMLDLGASMEEIAEKTGFSQSTVRRRVKMAELDPKTLEKVSGRQISLGDFDALAEIKDLKIRNEVLKDIGTADFGRALEKGKIREKVSEKMPQLKAWLKEHGAKKIEWSERYGKYEGFTGKDGRYYSYINIAKLGERGEKLPEDKDVEGVQLYYALDNGFLALCVENKKGRRTQKSQEQKDRERAAREAKKQIREISALHYALRKRFIEELRVSAKNKEAVLRGALQIALYYAHCSGTNHVKAVTERLGLKSYEYKTDPIVRGIEVIAEKELALAVYELYGDDAGNCFAFNMEMAGYFPRFDAGSHNTPLTLLYKWLCLLGYGMSEEECQMMDGTHPLYQAEKAFQKAAGKRS